MHVSKLVVLLPALAASHGIHLPATKDPEEARQAGLWSRQHIENIVEDCRDQLEHCRGAVGWEAQARCLIAGHEDIKDEACLHRTLSAAQHLPAALFAAMMTEGGSGDLGAGPVNNYGCNASTDPHPYIWSYHIHIQFTNETRDVMEKFTADFRELFMGGRDYSNECRMMSFVEDLWNFNSVGMDDVEHHHFAGACQQFLVNDEHIPFTPGGPFYHSNTGFTVSPTMWHEVLPWVMSNRPMVDNFWILTHPNSGCQYADIKHWSGWAGESSELYYPILGEMNGCLWAGCNDKALGCIAFNHEDEREGYGECFNPPRNWDSPLSATGTMTLLPGSNTTDITWESSQVVLA